MGDRQKNAPARPLAGSSRRAFLWVLAGTGALLLVWEAASRIAGSALILPGPLPVLERFLALAVTEKFALSLGNSFLRVMGGIALSAPLGILAGLAAALDRRAGFFLRPLFSVIAATPVMSVILIAFLALGQERTPVFTAFLMVFPVMAANTIGGIQAADPLLKEMFQSYGLGRREKLFYLYIPALTPFLLAGLRSSLSLCWKVVVAAEVLVQPLRALGTGMQQAKAQLETAELFAWTLATVLAAALTEALLGACRTCGFLHQNQRKNPDFGAPLGVCRVKNALFARFLSLKWAKPDKLLGLVLRLYKRGRTGR